MIRPPPWSTATDPLLPATTLFRSYLPRIARNLSVDRTRRQTRDRVASYRILLGRDGAACPDQTLRIEAMDVLHLYRRVVRDMPPKTRRIFVMHSVHRRTYQEIAAELGVCVKTVEHPLSRALRLCDRKSKRLKSSP